MKLEGSVIVVTGASSGIGRAIAIALARRGADLALAARRIDATTTLAEECRRFGVRAIAYTTDVTDRVACSELLERASADLGPVDALVVSAGYGHLGPAGSADPGELTRMIQTNFLGAVWCTQAVLPAMIARGHGSILYVSSILGIMGNAGMSGYAASKFALNGYAESIRDEVLPSGVMVSLLCPATTATSLFDDDDRSSIPAASRLLPVMSPERVARAAVSLLESGRARKVLPVLAAVFMKFKEIAPVTAHAVMRAVSRMLSGGRSEPD